MYSIQLQNVSIKFRSYSGRATGLKESVMRWLSPPTWTHNSPKEESEFWALRHIDLFLKEGDRLGIIGHNGAGKSTLLKVISRIYRPTEGTVSVQGRIAALIDIGAGFNPELSGRENVYLNGAILGIPKKVLAERMASVIEFSELSNFMEMPVKYYSTGMYLRLAFAIATEISPDILILDELFAGGDAAFIQKANVRLDHFIARSKILIVVAHNMEYICRYCNRAIVLDHGRILAQGNPKDVVEGYLEHSRGNREALAPYAIASAT